MRVGRKAGYRPVVGLSSGLLWTCGFCVLVSFVLGGGTRQGLWSDAIVQLVCLPLLFAALLPLAGASLSTIRWPLVLVIGALAIPLLQLIPLPPSVWTMLPGRQQFLDMYATAGIAPPWLPLSLSPDATWRAVLSLIPPVAVFLAVLQIGLRERRTLTLLFAAVALASVALGLAQAMYGPRGALRLYAYASNTTSVGFFANRNHYAAFLYSVLPFLAAWIIGVTEDRRPERYLTIVVSVLVFIAMIVGLAFSQSRGGLLIAGLAAIGGFALSYRHAGPTSRKAMMILGVAAVVSALVVANFAFFVVAERFANGVVDQNRLMVAANTITAATAFQPAGSGIGTFVPVYQMFETGSSILAVYMNHAHNDWLELWLEGGWPAVAVLAAFVAWFGVTAVRIWRRKPFEGASVLDTAIARAASLVIVGLLIHSGFDYPLRTTANTVLFAFCAALMIAPVKTERHSYLPHKWTVWLEQRRARRARHQSAGWAASP